MKKYLSLLFVLVLGLSIVACGDDDDDNPLIGSWYGVNEIEGMSMLVAFEIKAKGLSVEMFNPEDLSVVYAKQEGTYSWSEGKLKLTITKELDSNTGELEDLDEPEIESTTYVLSGTTLTVTTSEDLIFTLHKKDAGGKLEGKWETKETVNMVGTDVSIVVDLGKTSFDMGMYSPLDPTKAYVFAQKGTYFTAGELFLLSINEEMTFGSTNWTPTDEELLVTWKMVGADVELDIPDLGKLILEKE